MLHRSRCSTRAFRSFRPLLIGVHMVVLRQSRTREAAAPAGHLAPSELWSLRSFYRAAEQSIFPNNTLFPAITMAGAAAEVGLRTTTTWTGPGRITTAPGLSSLPKNPIRGQMPHAEAHTTIPMGSLAGLISGPRTPSPAPQ